MDQILANIAKIPADVWYFVSAAAGGFARLALGIEDGTSTKGELKRIFFISIPIGGSVGHFIGSLSCVNLPFVTECVSLQPAAPFAAVLFGIAALNIVRKIALEGLSALFNPLIELIKAFKR